MNEYKKKAIVITYENKPILLCEIKEFSAEEFVRIGKECAKNKESLKKLKGEKQKLLDDELKRIEEEIRHLKGED